MVAIVAGNGLGMLGGSVLGEAAQGQGSERFGVNVANGNLIVQQQDEVLIGLGLDTAVLRTYNSQGLNDDDNGDNWAIGFYRRLKIASLVGTVNTAGSSIVRVLQDGSEQRFVYNTSKGCYVSTDGSGAHDTLKYAGGVWTYSQDDGVLVETYDSNGRLTASRDRDGLGLTYGYNASGLLTQVSDSSGQTTYLDYSGTLLTQLRVVSAGLTQRHARYAYDSLNRLQTVTVDLTPSINAIGDGKIYTTSYSYDGTSTRIASVSQSDGSGYAISYVQVGGSYRVGTLTDGEGRVTRFSYDTTARRTDVTDPLGEVTSYHYDSRNRLTKLEAPAVNGGRATTVYGYDSADNLTSVTDATGNTVTYGYDGSGNQILQRDALGNTITRTYSSTNRLLTETVYLVPDPDGAGSGQPAQPQTSRYAYDGEGHLRFVVDAEGGVTEHRYDASGQRTATIKYTGGRYAVGGLGVTTSLSESQLNTWVAGQDKSKSQRSDYSYDFRGNLSSKTGYARVDSAGTGVLDGTEQIEQFVYDQRGQLLQRIDGRDNSTLYTYDGLGRVLTVKEPLTPVKTTVYDDANRAIRISAPNGLLTTQTYNRSGELVSIVNSGSGITTSTTRHYYDANGQLRYTQGPTGIRTYNFYDEAGRLVGTIDGNGVLTEQVYDAAGRVIQQITYHNKASTAGLVNADGSAAVVGLASKRPAAHANDRASRTIYDSAGRVSYTLDGEGYATYTSYDGTGNVKSVKRYAVAVATSLRALDPSQWALNQAHADNRTTRYFYDAAGRQRYQVDGEGYAAELKYDAQGQLIEKIRHPNKISVGDSTTTAGVATAIGTLSAAALREIFIYDASGRLIYSINAEGHVTRQSYDQAGNVAEKIRYAQPIDLAALPANPTAADVGLEPEPIWQQSFDGDYDGLTGSLTTSAFSDMFALESGRLRISTAPRSAATYSSLAGKGLHDFQSGLVLRSEITTGSESSGRYLLVAAQNTGSGTTVRRHGAYFRHGTLYANYYDPAASGYKSVALGSIKNDTSYVVEVELTAGGTRLYVYERGTARSSGFRHDTAYTDWGKARQVVYGYGNINQPVTHMYIESMSEQWGLSNADAGNRIETFQYDAENRLIRSVSYDGTLSTYSYNHLDKLTDTTTGGGTFGAADSTPTRTSRLRYDLLGRVTAEMTAEGAAKLAAGSITEAVAWNDYATKYAYDAAGRKISSTDPNGHKTLYFYDNSGRLTHTVNHLGEVSETRYTVFGDVYETYAYNGRISTTSLIGGLVNSTLTSRIDGIRTSGFSRTQHLYDRRGLNTQTIDAGNRTTKHLYNAFGEAYRTERPAVGGGITVTQRLYSARGLLTQITDDASGIKRVTKQQYDAFGRLSKSWDANNQLTSYSYDKRGQVIAVTDPLNHSKQTTYDAFGRKLTISNALGETTIYAYDDQSRSVVVTTPEGVRTTTVRNRFGEEVRVVDGAGNATVYEYDQNGQLKRTLDALNNDVTHSYDRAGRLYETTDARGTITRYVYDAANRVLDRIVDPAGLALKTSYTYDGQGRTITATEGAGTAAARTTKTDYNADGSVFRVTKAHGTADAVVTEYAYDAQGNQAKVIEAFGKPEARVTRYVYDNLGRLTFTVDAAGYVSEVTYNANGDAVTRTRYAQPIAIKDYANLAAVRAELALHTGADAPRVEHYAYDAAGRQRFHVDPEGYVTEYVYDDADRVVLTRRYASKLDIDFRQSQPTAYATQHGGGTPAVSSDGDVLDLSGNTWQAVGIDYVFTQNTVIEFDFRSESQGEIHGIGLDNDNTHQSDDRFIQLFGTQSPAMNTAYKTYPGDGGWQHFRIPVGKLGSQFLGAMTKLVFINDHDAAGGNGHSAFRGVRIYEAPAGGVSGVDAQWLSAALAPQQDDARTTRSVYDADGRQVYSVNAEGYVTETVYNARGAVSKTIRYATAPDLAGLSDRITKAELRAKVSESELDRTTRYVYDDAGRLTFTIDGEGYVTENVYDQAGNVVETIKYDRAVELQDYRSGRDVELALTKLWGQDFSAGTSGLTGIAEAAQYYSLVDGRLKATTAVNSADVSPKVVATRSYSYQPGRAIRGEIRMGTSSAGRQFGIGIQSGTFGTTQYRAHAAKFIGGEARSYRHGGTGNQLIGSVRNDVTYVVELVTGETGTTLYVYEKGTKRENGYVDTFNVSGWGNFELFFWTHGGPSDTPSHVWVDNLSEHESKADLVARARREVFDYDAAGRLEQVTNAANAVTRNTYDAAGNLTRVTEAVGTAQERITERKYDKLGRLTEETIAFGKPEAITQRFGYDAFGNQTSLIDPRGIELAEKNTEWAKAQRQILQGALGLSSAGVADHASLTAAQKNALRALYTSTQEFDKLGRKTVETDALGNKTQTKYDAFGNIVKVIDPRGYVGYFYYGKNDKIGLQVDPEGYGVRYEYDAFGNQIRETKYKTRLRAGYNESLDLTAVLAEYVVSPSNSNVVETIYDREGRVEQTKTALGGGQYLYEYFSYDAFGNKIRHTNKNGALFRYFYDTRGNLIREELPVTTTTAAGVRIGVVNEYEYDAFGQRTKSIEAVGAREERVTSVEYDALGRVKVQKAASFLVYDPASGGSTSKTPTTTNNYDARGNLIEVIDPKGRRTVRYYDALNRMIGEVDAAGYYRRHQYDAVGNLIHTQAYDQALAAAANPAVLPTVATGATKREMFYSYDANNRRTISRTGQTVLFTKQDGLNPSAAVTTEVVYDANGNVVKSIDGNGNASFFYFDKAGRQILSVDPLGYVIKRDYDAQGNVVRESKFASKLSAATLLGLDENANPAILAAEVANGAFAADNRVTEFVYDSAGRMIEQRVLKVEYATVDVDTGALTLHQGANAGTAVTKYTYDGLGNVTSVLKPGFDGTQETFFQAMPPVTGGAMVGADRVTARSTVALTSQYFDSCTETTSMEPVITVQLPPMEGYGAGKVTVVVSATNLGSRSVVVDAATPSVQLSFGRVSAVIGQLTFTTKIYKATDAGSKLVAQHSWTPTNGQIVNPLYAHLTYEQYLQQAYDKNSNITEPYYITTIVNTTGSSAIEERFHIQHVPATATAVQLRYKTSTGAFGGWISIPKFAAGHYVWNNPNIATGNYDYEYRVLEGTQEIRYVKGTFSVDPSSRIEVLSHETRTTQVRGMETASYDGLGRKDRESQGTFTDYLGRLVTPTTTTTYDAHGNVVSRTREGVVDADDQITRSTYDSAGNLRYEIDPVGGRIDYDYDILGNVIRTRQTVRNANNTTRQVVTHYGYDQFNRLTSQLTDGTGTTQNWGYNAHGEMVTRGINGQDQEYFVYDNLGRLFKTNSQDGTARLYLYDANGNATLEIRSIEQNLAGYTQAQVASLLSAQSTVDYQTTVSVYDARNQLTDTFQASMDYAKTLANTSARYTWESLRPIEGGQLVDADRGTVNIIGTEYVPSIYDKNTPKGLSMTVTWPVAQGYGDGRVLFEFSSDRFGSFSTYLSGTATSYSFSRTNTAMANTVGTAIRVTIKKETSQGLVTLMPTKSITVTKQTHTTKTLTGYDSKGNPIYRIDTSYTYHADATGYIEERLHFQIQPPEADYLMVRTKLANSTSWSGWTSVPRFKAGEFIWSNPNRGAGTYDYEYIVKKGGSTGTVLREAKGQLNFNSASAITVYSHLVKVKHVDYEAVEGGLEAISIRRQQGYNAFGEIISETDGRGFTTEMYYNALGKLIKKIEPETTAWVEGEYGVVSEQRLRPTYDYHYDLMGNAVVLVDARGNISRRTYLNGQLQKTFNPDGGVSIRGYDVLGNLRTLTDEIGRTTTYTYDKKNQLKRQERQGGAWDEYDYDELGNRIRHRRIRTASEIDTESYVYDNAGRVTQHTSFASRITRYSYVYESAIGGTHTVVDALGNTRSVSIGGYAQTVTDAAGGTSVDKQDYFGRLHYRKDLGNHTYSYQYNYAGQLKKQTSSAGQNIDYEYYDNGYLKYVKDHGIDSLAHFQYDANGNRVFEAYTKVSTGFNGHEPYQLHTVEYDELNRIKKVHEAKYDIEYKYDEVGNRRSVYARYHDGVDADVKQQEFWYSYDSMNRFVVTMGTRNASGVVVRGTTGYNIEYNAASQRTRAVSTADDGSVIDERYFYDDNGFLQFMRIGSSSVNRAERVNDLAGNLLQYIERNADDHETSRHVYTYDRDGNQLQDHDQQNNRGVTYNLLADGRVNYTQTYDSDGNAAVIKTSYVYDKWDSYKQKAIHITATHGDLKGWKPGHSYFTYDVNGHLLSVTDAPEGQRGRRLEYVNNHLGQVLRRNETTEMNITVDANGNLVSANMSDKSLRHTRRFYYHNGVGIGDVGNDSGDFKQDYAQLLRQKELEGKGSRNAIATAIVDQTWQNSDSSVAQLYGDGDWVRGAVINGTAKKLNKNQHLDIAERVSPVSSADFDQNYQPIGPTYPGATAGSYEVRSGDTLQSIAQAVFGDAALWYLIADANGLSTDSTLTPGQRLTIPNVVTNIHNSADTFKPYDPGYAIGDTSPTLPEPPPPPKGKCGLLGQLIIIIVAVVVTVLTAGAAALAMAGTLGSATMGGVMAAGGAALAGGAVAGVGAVGLATAAAIGAAVGSVASQALAIGLGYQEKMNWGAVGASALTAGVVSGLGSTGVVNNMPGASNFDKAASTLTRNVVSQQSNRLFGQQKSFNWGSFAATAFGGSTGLTSGLANGVTGWAPTGLASPLAAVAGGMITAGISHTVNKALGREAGKLDWANVAVDAFGNWVGEKLVSVMSPPPADVRRAATSSRLGKFLEGVGEWLEGSAQSQPAAAMVGTPGMRDYSELLKQLYKRNGTEVALQPAANGSLPVGLDLEEAALLAQQDRAKQMMANAQAALALPVVDAALELAPGPHVRAPVFKDSLISKQVDSLLEKQADGLAKAHEEHRDQVTGFAETTSVRVDELVYMLDVAREMYREATAGLGRIAALKTGAMQEVPQHSAEDAARLRQQDLLNDIAGFKATADRVANRSYKLHMDFEEKFVGRDGLITALADRDSSAEEYSRLQARYGGHEAPPTNSLSLSAAHLSAAIGVAFDDAVSVVMSDHPVNDRVAALTEIRSQAFESYKSVIDLKRVVDGYAERVNK